MSYKVTKDNINTPRMGTCARAGAGVETADFALRCLHDRGVNKKRLRKHATRAYARLSVPVLALMSLEALLCLEGWAPMVCVLGKYASMAARERAPPLPREFVPPLPREIVLPLDYVW